MRSPVGSVPDIAAGNTVFSDRLERRKMGEMSPLEKLIRECSQRANGRSRRRARRARASRTSGSLDGLLRNVVQEAVRDELAKVLPGLLVQPTKGGAGVEYLTPAEAAEMVRVRPETVRTWVRGGDLRGHYAGRKLLIRRDELEAYLARGKEPTSREADEKRLDSLLGDMAGLGD
jgi:excisionase family DNA binding protein